MADPLSILGSVAASIQLVDVAAKSLLGTVKFVRELRDIPRKTAAQLEDVNRSTERVRYMCTTVLGAGSITVDNVDSAILARLSTCADGLRLGLDGAQEALKPLVDGYDAAKNKPVRRLWNAVVSKTQESAILEKLERVEKRNLEMIGELQIAGFAVQAGIRSSLGETSTSARNHHSESMNRLDSLVELGIETRAAIGASRDEMVAGFQAIKISSDGMLTATGDVQRSIYQASTNIDSLGQKTDSIHQHTAALVDGMNTQFRMTRDDMQRLIRQSEIRMNKELQDVRDQLIIALTGSGSSSEKSSQKRISSILKHKSEEQHLLQVSTQVALMRHPSALRDAWGRSINSRQRFRSCCCRARTTSETTSIWGFRLRSTWRTEHRDNCPYYKNGQQSWTYSFGASLYPFLGRTVEMALGAATGPGVWSMTPSLRIFKVVKHSESPLFQAFSTLPETCATWNDDEYQLIWSPCLAQHLEALNEQIQRQVSLGQFSGCEVDEDGYTLLFELFHLLILLEENWKDFQMQLQMLLETIVMSGVDINARTKATCHISGGTRNIESNQYVMYYILSVYCGSEIIAEDGFHRYRHNDLYRSITAIEFLLTDGFGYYNRLGPNMPFYGNLLRHGMFKEFLSSMRGNPASSGNDKIQFLRKHLEVAEAMGYDELALAILRRSMNDVSDLARRTTHSVKKEAHEDLLSYIELALGWTQGMEYLMQLGFDVMPAIAKACKISDAASLRCLLKTEQAIFATNDPNWLFSKASSSPEREVYSLVVAALKEKRKLLSNLAHEIFTKEELNMIWQGPEEHLFMDGKASVVYDQLQKRIPVPTWLDCCCMASPYHFLAHGDQTVDFLDEILNAGFIDVDVHDIAGDSPLLFHVKTLSYLRPWTLAQGYSNIRGLTEWFISRGAKIESDAQRLWPNILFYLAFYRSQSLYNEGIDCSMTLATNQAAIHLHATTDSCRCFCSSSGCTPVHLLLRCHPEVGQFACNKEKDRLKLLQLWFEEWIVGVEDQISLAREACQLELFERLGMAHTCCKQKTRQVDEKDSQTFPIGRPSSPEIELIQSEDANHQDQLSNLMAHYDSWIDEFGNEAEVFKNSWWAAVDAILPPLLLSEGLCETCNIIYWNEQYLSLRFYENGERVVSEMREARAESEKEALRRNGFSDSEDFRDVINVYFTKLRGEIFDTGAGAPADCEQQGV